MTSFVGRQARQMLLSCSAALGACKIFRGTGGSVTVLLLHKFFSGDESRQRSIERLRRRLDWICTKYTVLSMSNFLAGMRSGNFPNNGILVTADDANLEILDVASEFSAFQVPLSIFVCCGWTARHSPNAQDDVVARAASAIQWYDGEAVEISYGRGRMMRLAPELAAKNIDNLITDADIVLSEVQELCGLIGKPRNFNPLCTWNDLRDLCALGFELGAHSVTHVPLSRLSMVRRRFEVEESKRLCELIAGRCDVFSYPYGTDDVHNAGTAADLRSAGYSAAFLSHSAFVRSSDDPMVLPRITIPDEPMSDVEFRSRAQGGGIALRHLKTAMRI